MESTWKHLKDTAKWLKDVSHVVHHSQPSQSTHVTTNESLTSLSQGQMPEHLLPRVGRISRTGEAIQSAK